MYYNKAQTVITTSIPLVTNYGIAVSMTLKSEDKKKKVNSDVGHPIWRYLLRELSSSDGNSSRNKTERTDYLMRTSFLVFFRW